MIEFNDISMHYGEKRVLNACHFSVRDGEFFVLVGPSGSGKTTTLKMINRLIEPSSGDILFNGKSIGAFALRDLRLNIGYVLQQIALFPNLTVAENIELIPEMKGWSKNKRRKHTQQLLEKVHLDPAVYLHRKPAELSGGEQQRIGILRAIAAKPKVILMDEPFSALDPISRRQLQMLIKELHREHAVTIVFVTHDMQEAMLLGDRICVMKSGDILQIDTPENIQMHPANVFVAQFFTPSWPNWETCSANDLLLSGNIEPEGAGYAAVTVSPDTLLPDIIVQLASHQAVALLDNHQKRGVITHQSMIQFLAQRFTKEMPEDE